MQIAVSAWSFHKSLYSGGMRQVDVPERAAALGFKHIELLEIFLHPKPPGRLARLFSRRPAPGAHTSQPDYSRKTLNEIRSARLRTGTRLVCWAIETDLTLADPGARQAQLSHIATALQAARHLGAPLVRLTTGGQAGNVSGVGHAIDTLRNVTVVAASVGLWLAVENHFGLSEDTQALAEIITAVNQPGVVGACLDFANFAEGQFAEGIKILAPLAIHVHAKSREVGPDGEETRIDYRAALDALKAAGYDGAISIEYEGGGDPQEGIRKTRELIERYWERT